MILIYTHSITSRVTYTMDLVFGTVLNTAYKLTDDKKEFEEYTLPKLAYTSDLSLSRIFILSNSLLFETVVNSTFPVAEKEFLAFPKFFKSTQKDFLGYDIFAMVFYFVSRYE